MSELADLFGLQLRAAGLDGYTRELKFHPARRWRFDFAWEADRIAVEVDGGQWVPGTGHNTGAGRERDCTKDAEAALLGWRVLRVTSSMVRDGRALGYLERLLSGARKPAEGSFGFEHSTTPLAENATK